ncbi:MAG: hypothetical protein OHK0039_09290 [Bacteroidia bacterium]
MQFWKKRSRIEKIILVGFINLFVILTGFWLMDKQPNRDFYIPQDYAGWISVRYGVPGAPALPLTDGVQQLHISDSGYLETSTPLKVGWRRDRYFWYDSTGTPTPIPSHQTIDGETRLYVHRHEYFARSYEYLLPSLPAGTDTLLPDGTRIRLDTPGQVDYTPGTKTLEYFYLSRQPESVLFNPPEHPRHEGLRSTQDRQLR